MMVGDIVLNKQTGNRGTFMGTAYYHIERRRVAVVKLDDDRYEEAPMSEIVPIKATIIEGKIDERNLSYFGHKTLREIVEPFKGYRIRISVEVLEEWWAKKIEEGRAQEDEGE